MKWPLIRGNNSAPARLRRDSLDVTLSAFESETAAVFVRTAPVNEHIILYVLCAMIVLAFGLSAVVKLDRVVTGIGKVIPIGGQIYISPLNPGIVREVRVKVGDVVKKGGTLATLDPTFTAADFTQLQAQLASDQAAADRLQAEYEGKPYTPAGHTRAEEVQVALRLQRQAQFRSSVADFDARIGNAESTAAQYRHDMEEYKKRLTLAQDLEQMNTTLAKDGYVSKLQQMAASDSRVEIGRLMTDAQNELAATLDTMTSLKAQRAAFIQQWNSDLSSQVVTARYTLAQTRDSWEKAKKLDELQVLQAPEDAVVLKVGKLSAGAIVDSSSVATSSMMDPLFTLMPLNAPVEAELMVQSEDVGFIEPGQPVQIKLDAYPFLRHGFAKGVVKTVSEGSFAIDPDTQQAVPPYFKMRATFTEVHLHNVPADFRLVPGMTMQGDVMVGRRTILSYIIEGGLRTGSEAMREP